MQRSDYVLIAQVLQDFAWKIEIDDTVSPVIRAAKSAMLYDITLRLADVMAMDSAKFNREQFFSNVYRKDNSDDSNKKTA